MSFPEVHGQLSATRRDSAAGEQGSGGRRWQLSSQRAPDLATLSEGICHRTLRPTPRAGPTEYEATKSPSAHQARELQDSDFAGRYPQK